MRDIIKWIGGVAIVYLILYILVQTLMPKSINDSNPMDIPLAIAFFVSGCSARKPAARSEGPSFVIRPLRKSSDPGPRPPLRILIE